MYERMEPKRYPEPRDLRMQLEKHMMMKYRNKSLSEISLSTEIILKSIKPKNGGAEIPILKYKVINVDWEDTRGIKDVIFEKKLFKWMKSEENDYEDTGAGAY